ncbi:hypothetical protein MTR67_009489 [Solanum verrucosum]|uniref:SKP1 component dimerisation domain-containing protein n=1 Tax=Solanum verrucosum TaxID=315347 RepID=A0AAF0TEV7_SOLVR|nr:hypothetical protein MTR67_009489 [Solanum verrucosum]
MSSSTKFLTLKTYDGKEFVLDEQNNDQSDRILEEGVSKDMLMDFDKAFVKVHHSILHALILVVNFLNDKEILDMMCQEVADRIKGKTQEEICKEFDIKNDFTP